MLRYYFFTLTFVLAAWALQAQQDETLFGKSGLRLTGAWGGSQTCITALHTDNVLMRGGYFALEFNKEILLGLGSMRTNKSIVFDDGSGDRFSMDFGGLFASYVPQSYRAIHPKFSFLMGGGEVEERNGPSDKVFVFQPGGGAEFNVFRWFRLSLEGGYRFVSGSDLNRLTDESLSSLFVETKLRFGWSWGRRNASTGETFR